MRNGHLLAEANPSRLLSDFGMDTIEETFLSLCERQDEIKELDGGSLVRLETSSTSRPLYNTYKGKKQSYHFNWMRAKAVALGLQHYIASVKWTMLLACFMPTIQMFLFYITGLAKDFNGIELAIHNQDSYNHSFTEMFLKELGNQKLILVRFRCKLSPFL